MRKYRSRSRQASGASTGLAERTAERVRLSGEILKALADTVAANEKAQRRFRIAVLVRLSRIETLASMIHGAQIVKTKLLQLLHADSTGSRTWFLDCCGATTRRDQRLPLTNYDTRRCGRKR